MPVINAGTGVVTQINVFDVRPGMQDTLVGLLKDAASACRSDVPGWRSASLHLSLDGKTVVNYAQTDDQAAMRRVFAYLTTEGWLDRNRAFGTAHPGVYDVVWTLDR